MSEVYARMCCFEHPHKIKIAEEVAKTLKDNGITGTVFI